MGTGFAKRGDTRIKEGTAIGEQGPCLGPTKARTRPTGQHQPSEFGHGSIRADHEQENQRKGETVKTPTDPAKTLPALNGAESNAGRNHLRIGAE